MGHRPSQKETHLPFSQFSGENSCEKLGSVLRFFWAVYDDFSGFFIIAVDVIVWPTSLDGADKLGFGCCRSVSWHGFPPPKNKACNGNHPWSNKETLTSTDDGFLVPGYVYWRFCFCCKPSTWFPCPKKHTEASWIAPRNGLKEQTFGYFLSRSDKAVSLCVVLLRLLGVLECPKKSW